MFKQKERTRITQSGKISQGAKSCFKIPFIGRFSTVAQRRIHKLANAWIKSKLQRPPSHPGKARAFELLKIGSFKFPRHGLKKCSNAAPYRRICLSNAPHPKEQSSSAPVVFNKICQQMSLGPFSDDAAFTRLELLQKPNFNFETIKNDLKLN